MQTKLLALFTVILLVAGCKTTFQLGQCEQLFLDFNKGTLNGVSATASMDVVKKAFPCSTGETEEGKEFNCGGGVYFLKNDFYFYTYNDFIEVRKGFTGKMSKPVLGLNKDQLTAVIGQPDDILKHTDSFLGGETIVYQYAKKWGTLSFVEEEGTVTEIELHAGKKIGEIDYCF